MKVLVTGATGFVGSHVAEALLARGDAVRTLARPTSDTGLLESWKVEVIRGDLVDAEAVARACEGVDAVVHCAAKVGDWGPLEEYRKANVEALEHLCRACVGKPLQRFVLVSSLGVYEAKDHFGTDETAPLPARHIDGYTQSKVEAEHVAERFRRDHGLPLVVLRPGFVYGPRDRTVMPRILSNLRRRLVTYFGSRQKKMNNVYVGNLADAVLLALDRPGVVGETFNITDGECVTKRVFFETIADLAGLPRPMLTYPMWLARTLCGAFEWAGKTFGFAPVLNGARLKFMGLSLDYSIRKAREHLGYEPRVAFADGMRTTIEWLRSEGRLPETSARREVSSEPTPAR